ncbi:MAG: RdgB/HAM1 family non-canonical purine NTP pyrophosphatase [Bacteroidales bacterium]|nr:RdgB/HAM1 family non-canonical purine NTP pyrophosphatase [Bacteroidales bacterium]
MKLVFATANKGKLREASEILGTGFEVISSAQAGITEDIPENGNTLKANSIQKARHIWNKCGLDCFADDTGLEVDILGGEPGVHTARYAGEGHDFDANIDKLLREMAAMERAADVASKAGLHLRPLGRRARFKSVVTLIIGGEEHFFEGTLEGRISLTRSGNGGFGYDPVFIPDEYPDRTLADITEDQKNAISHRGKALRAMADWLAQNVKA